MAYDERLAERMTAALLPEPGITQRKMFGGLAFMHRGNMACGIVGDRLMLRLSPDAHEAALTQPHVSPMDFTGRPMRGMVYVEPPGIVADADLARWLQLALAFTSSLPPK